MNRDNITWLAVYENNITDELLSQIDNLVKMSMHG